jgi:hypothetical protein
MIVNEKSNGETECMISITELRAVVKGFPATGALVEARNISMPDASGLGLLFAFRPDVTITQSVVDAITGTKT